MKRLLLTIILVATFGALVAQSPFKPVPQNLFTSQSADRNAKIAGTFLWRFSTVVTATELTWDKANKQFYSAPLSSVGPAIGWKHFVPLEDGTPYSDWGVSAALLMGVDINQVNPASMKVAILANLFQYFNFGGAWTFNQANHFGILVGASINF